MADLTQQPDGNRESGKQRSRRIRLDHHKAWDAVSAGKWLLTAACLIAASAAVGWMFAAPGGEAAFTHGPLSRPHSEWQGDCQVCHAPGVPLRAGAVSLASVDAGQQNRCMACHAVSPHYHRPQDLDPACSSCHREHRGDVDLTLVGDADCTTCHAEPASVTPAPNPADLLSVAGFPAEHPPFRNLPADLENGDPGSLGFSHSRHMRLGLTTHPDGRPGEAFRYADMAPGERGRYLRPGQPLDDAVQLDCASCHELSSASGGAALQTVAEGVYLPVAFEQHCQACHPLRSGPAADSPPIPHGLSADETDTHLLRVLRSRWFEAADDRLQREPARPVPGRSWLLRDEAVSATRAIEEQLDASRRYLRQRCLECHEVEAGSLTVAPTNVPVQWFAESRFNHFAHAKIDCRDCHAGAYAEDAGLSLVERKLESRRVVIPGIDNCAQCHAPRDGEAGGVRHDCVLCHEYHRSESWAGDAWRGGPGASSAAALRNQTPSERTRINPTPVNPTRINGASNGGDHAQFTK